MKFSHVFLVATHTVLILLIAYFGGVWGNIYSNIISVLAIMIIFWTIATMRFSVSPLPEARENQKLITTGPFRFVRHPIYSAGLFLTLAWVMNKPLIILFAIWVMLLMIILIKIRIEEWSLLKKFPEYKTYCRKTRRLIPGIY